MRVYLCFILFGLILLSGCNNSITGNLYKNSDIYNITFTPGTTNISFEMTIQKGVTSINLSLENFTYRCIESFCEGIFLNLSSNTTYPIIINYCEFNLPCANETQYIKTIAPQAPSVDAWDIIVNNDSASLYWHINENATSTILFINSTYQFNKSSDFSLTLTNLSCNTTYQFTLIICNSFDCNSEEHTFNIPLCESDNANTSIDNGILTNSTYDDKQRSNSSIEDNNNTSISGDIEKDTDLVINATLLHIHTYHDTHSIEIVVNTSDICNMSMELDGKQKWANNTMDQSFKYESLIPETNYTYTLQLHSGNINTYKGIVQTSALELYLLNFSYIANVTDVKIFINVSNIVNISIDIDEQRFFFSNRSNVQFLVTELNANAKYPIVINVSNGKDFVTYEKTVHTLPETIEEQLVEDRPLLIESSAKAQTADSEESTNELTSVAVMTKGAKAYHAEDMQEKTPETEVADETPAKIVKRDMNTKISKSGVSKTNNQNTLTAKITDESDVPNNETEEIGVKKKSDEGTFGIWWIFLVIAVATVPSLIYGLSRTVKQKTRVHRSTFKNQLDHVIILIKKKHYKDAYRQYRILYDAYKQTPDVFTNHKEEMMTLNSLFLAYYNLKKLKVYLNVETGRVSPEERAVFITLFKQVSDRLKSIRPYIHFSYLDSFYTVLVNQYEKLLQKGSALIEKEMEQKKR